MFSPVCLEFLKTVFIIACIIWCYILIRLFLLEMVKRNQIVEVKWQLNLLSFYAIITQNTQNNFTFLIVQKTQCFVLVWLAILHHKSNTLLLLFACLNITTDRRCLLSLHLRSNKKETSNICEFKQRKAYYLCHEWHSPFVLCCVSKA